MNKICFRLIDNMEDYVFLFKDLQRYYAGRVTTFIDSVPEETYYVQLIDEGFTCMASEKDLILNSNEDYLKEPSQAYTLPLDIELDCDRKMQYIINYGLQKVANTKTNFSITITDNNKIRLSYKDRKLSEVSVNDFLVEFIKHATDLPHNKVSDAMRAHIEATETGTLAKLYRIKVDTPRFVLPVEEGTYEGEKPLTMKCQQVFNPFEFYLKLEKDDRFKAFVDEMNAFYKDSPPEQADPINTNELYTTRYNDQLTRLLILTPFKEGHFSCLLFDKGVIGTIKKEDIFELDSQFKYEPPRAIKASLAFVKPTSEKWSREANEFFRDQVKFSRLSVCAISNGSSGLLYCILTKDGVNIGDLLIDSEFAEIDI
ncbi:Tudor domain-containing protein 7 [Tyrophagus putrescentiae]|nr:Tudor domain-containing protein 7 [Tyrophagus putrescentiae]